MQHDLSIYRHVFPIYFGIVCARRTQPCVHRTWDNSCTFDYPSWLCDENLIVRTVHVPVIVESHYASDSVLSLWRCMFWVSCLKKESTPLLGCSSIVYPSLGWRASSPYRSITYLLNLENKIMIFRCKEDENGYLILMGLTKKETNIDISIIFNHSSYKNPKILLFIWIFRKKKDGLEIQKSVWDWYFITKIKLCTCGDINRARKLVSPQTMYIIQTFLFTLNTQCIWFQRDTTHRSP